MPHTFDVPGESPAKKALDEKNIKSLNSSFRKKLSIRKFKPSAELKAMMDVLTNGSQEPPHSLK